MGEFDVNQEKHHPDFLITEIASLMQLGVNVPDFGPGTDPGVLREWARIVEGLGFDLLMVSDHVAVTPDVAERYPDPAPFYEPFTTLSRLAGMTTRVRLGTTVLVLPYRHPLLVARMATNLHQLSGGRLGVGVGWARREFDALGVAFTARGRMTDEHLVTLRKALREEAGEHTAPIPVWVGGNSEAGIRRAIIRRCLASSAGHPFLDAHGPHEPLAAGIRAPHRSAADHHTGQRSRATRGHQHP